ncbi:sulfatase-like hydrolase/transferase [Rubripirellula reticaptiva]|uniref:Arylsulfatase n=1 Tax=Rubripirellula reticaptiva TaxID=2528013 RepID=A0A5C6ERY8_9BACT|nr:sulfatase-like hydrolase/transferase [Rubripirellula reticaptiva]TWU51772.1 Arylsulfatase precursor [Rubripirellula reticaptiva]
MMRGLTCRFFLSLVVLQTGFTAAMADERDPSRPPNVILILADDLAVGDLGGGDGSPSRTMHLDRLAEQSVRFNQAYSASCVCAPARAALLTGRYPHRTGVVTLNMNTYPVMTRLRRDEETMPELLRRAGYVTGLIGKWHVGLGDGFHPLDRGFDEYEGFSGSSDVGYYEYAFDVQGKVRRVADRYLTDDLNDRAIEFVRRHRDQRFFLHLAHYAPHRPLQAPAEIIQKYSDHGFDESTSTIYAMIEVMDHGIGRLLEELDELDLAKETVIVFASDNGPDPLTGVRFNHHLRGTKYQVDEGGIRVPLFVRWPGVFAAGERNQQVHFVDLLPTLLDFTRTDTVTTANPLDGKSFARVLRDPSADFSPTRFWQWNRGRPNYTHNAAVREGKFKLVRPFVTRGSKIQDSTLPAELYDLDSDPTESTNIAAEHPDLVQQLGGKLQRWADDVEKERVRPESEKRRDDLPLKIR